MSKVPARRAAGPARRKAPAKRKPAAKRKPGARTVDPAPPPVAPPPVPHRPAEAKPSNTLAVAAVACSVANFTFVPLIGGLAGSALGAVHLRKERQRPDLYTGKTMATVAVVIGIVTSILPLLVLTLIKADDWTPVPFVAVFVYAAFVFWTALQGRSTKEKVAIFGGSLVATAIAALLAVALAIGFYYLMVLIGREVGSAIGDAFSNAFDGIFDGIADSFGSCN